jgi:hypothetical protein
LLVLRVPGLALRRLAVDPHRTSVDRCLVPVGLRRGRVVSLRGQALGLALVLQRPVRSLEGSLLSSQCHPGAV